MKKFLLICILSVSVFAIEQLQEGVGWLDIFAYDEASGKERVLLIGDSIVRQNAQTIRDGIKNKYVLTRLSTSKSICSKQFNEQLAIAMHKQYKMILINNGLHDFSSSDEEYKACYIKTIEFLKSNQPNAQLMLMATTGVNGIEKRNTIVIGRNEVVKRLSKKYNLTYIDLYSIFKNDSVYFRDAYHHKTGGGKFTLEQNNKSYLT